MIEDWKYKLKVKFYLGVNKVILKKYLKWINFKFFEDYNLRLSFWDWEFDRDYFFVKCYCVVL